MVIGEFVDTYPPFLDGVGRVTLSYCQTLASLGHIAYYIAPDAPRWKEEYDFPVMLQRSMPFPGEQYRIGLPGSDIRYRRQLARVPFDIVHAQSPFTAGEEALRVAKKLNVPLVATFHSKYRQDIYDKTHSEVIAKAAVQLIVHFYHRCDAVWTVNNATADVLRSYGYKGAVTIMENGTNTEPVNPGALERMRGRLKPDGRPMLLFVGQHNYKKNLHGVLGACAILKRTGFPFRLVTAGDGPDAAAIRQEAAELGIAEDCTFLGFVSDRDELMAVYSLSDLLVFPSVYDNAPMVLREAAVMKTPGLLVRGSCAAEGIRDGENGFFSRDESAEAIAETIRRAIPLTGPVGERASQTIPVAWKDIMKTVVTEYERLIERKKRGL